MWFTFNSESAFTLLSKSTGFALLYDSVEALKKFEPRYRLVRIGVASKIEKPSRQQRMCSLFSFFPFAGLSLFCRLRLVYWGLCVDGPWFVVVAYENVGLTFGVLPRGCV